MDFPLHIIQKRIKHAYIRIHPSDGTVRVSAPKRWSKRDIQRFVQSKSGWIAEQLKHTQARLEQTHGMDGQRPWWGAWQPSGDLSDDEWQRRYLDAVRMAAQPLLARWSQAMSLAEPKLTVRAMKTRWGSCTPSRGSIRLSAELAKYPPACLEYVLVHELVHFYEPSHNHRFKRLMTQYLPDWPQHKHRLNQPPVCSVAQ